MPMLVWLYAFRWVCVFIDKAYRLAYKIRHSLEAMIRGMLIIIGLTIKHMHAARSMAECC